MRIKVKTHCVSVLLMAVFSALAISSATSPEPPVAVPVVYKGIPFSELENAISAVNSPGQGFIVEEYVVDGRFFPDALLMIAEKQKDSPKVSVPLWNEHLKKSLSYAQPQQFEVYTKDELDNRLEKNKKYKIYIGIYGQEYYIDHNNTQAIYNKLAFIDKIEGLASIEEMKAKSEILLERRVDVYNNIIHGQIIMVDWQKAFSSKEDAIKWIKDIQSRFDEVEEVVNARRQLYDKDEKSFKYYPSKLMRDSLLKNKNNIIEAYNRYFPIVAEVEKVTAKGIGFEQFNHGQFNRGQIVDENLLSPFVNLTPYDNFFLYKNQNQVKEKIADLNKSYSKLLDTYPVN